MYPPTVPSGLLASLGPRLSLSHQLPSSSACRRVITLDCPFVMAAEVGRVQNEASINAVYVNLICNRSHLGGLRWVVICGQLALRISIMIE